jgi:hypothetical protein
MGVDAVSDVLSRFDDLADRLSDEQGERILRSMCDAEIIAEHGQAWFDENKPKLDAEWKNALATLGFAPASGA